MKKIYLFLLTICLVTASHSSFGARATALSGGGTAVGNLCITATNSTIYSFILSQSGTTGTGVLNGVTISLSGSYVASDLANLTLWYNTSNSLSGATPLLVLTTGIGPGSVSFSGLTQTLTSSGSTSSSIPYYFFVTATPSASAVGGHTIIVGAMASATGFNMAAGAQSGSATAGSAQTITPSLITGTASVCVGSTTSLADATGSGTWTSFTTSVATITSSGVVSGVSGGTSIISYTLSGCSATKTVTVSPAPATITPSATTSICTGVPVTFSNSTAGGTWSITAGTGTATVTAGGVVTGLTTGTVTLSYTTTACTPATKLLTINSQPTNITGTAGVCAGSVTTLASTPGGGTWSSATGTVATVNSGGGVFGVSTGTAVISYTFGSCAATQTVTVSAAPASISGLNTVCAGATITLSDTTSSGTWSVTAGTGTGTITAGGVLTGGNAGSVTVNYTTAGCNPATYPVTIGASPTTLTGTATVCQGLVTTLASTPGSGTWSSVTPSVATVNNNGGVFGVTGGTTIISYTVGTCGNARTVTVVSAPGVITGLSAVCTGSQISLSDGVGGGTWGVTSGTGTGTISAGGVLTGGNAGTVTVNYTTTGCTPATYPVTVNSLPSIGFTNNGSAVCGGSGAVITATGATSYSWSPSTGLSAVTGATVTATPSSATTYTVTGTSANGCSANATRIVAIPVNTATVTASSTSPTTCPGGTANLSGSASYGGSSYTYMSIPYAPVATTGTAGPTGDDNNSPATIFNFKFFGVNYTTVNICTNGWISFTNTSTSTQSFSLPNASAPGACIALGLHDFNTGGGNIKYNTIGTAPNRKFVVSYNAYGNFSGCGGTGAGLNTIQAILYEGTNIIDIMVGTLGGTCNNTVGIQNATGTDGVAPLNLV